MSRNAAYLAFLAYVCLSPFVAAAAFGSDTAFRIVSALNFGFVLGWAIRSGDIKVQVRFGYGEKAKAPRTAFSTDGAQAVADAFVSASERPFEPRCADPAVCGSEWTAGYDIGSPTVAVMCSRCGRTGTLADEACADFRAAAGSVA